MCTPKHPCTLATSSQTLRNSYQT